MSEDLFSLWFIPPEPAFRSLHRLITELADRYKTPRFTPHLTLLSGCALPATEACSIGERLAVELQPFPLRLLRVGCGSEFFRCVFAVVEKSPPLMFAHDVACEVFEKRERDFFPHVSLLYGNLEPALRQQIASELDVAQEFGIDRIFVVDTSHSLTPEQWRIVHEIEFSTRSPTAN